MAQTGFQYHFLALSLPLAGSCWSGRRHRRAGGRRGQVDLLRRLGGRAGGHPAPRPRPAERPSGRGKHTQSTWPDQELDSDSHNCTCTHSYSDTCIYTYGTCSTLRNRHMVTPTLVHTRMCTYSEKKKKKPDTAAAVKQGCKCEAVYMACQMIFVHDVYYQEHISRLYPASNSHSNPHMPSTQHSSVYGDVNVKLPADECFTFG